MKIIDRYIIRKFLITFFFSLTLILTVCVIWDITEKLDDFLEKQAPVKAIIFEYYFNFIPYFANLLAPLFVFIAVIFFTARMANNTEIIAILNSGVSFRRLLYPYMLVSTLLAGIAFYFSGWVIPHANKVRLEFENRYIKNKYVYRSRNIHRQISPGEFVYFDNFNNIEQVGFRFSLERIKDGKLTYKLMADAVRWDSIQHKWHVMNYHIREIRGMDEVLVSGSSFDTTLALTPADFTQRINNIETMDNVELSHFIRQEELRGAENTEFYLVEKYRRTAVPFATFILTVIGVSVAGRKIRGGFGLQIVFGLVLSFAYIFFMQVSYTFATGGGLSPLLAVWIPNILFAGIAFVLLRYAPH